MGSHHEDRVRVFKAFCDETRLRVFELLAEGEKCACHLLDELEISQSTLSYHMKILVESGLVDYRQEGKWTHYRISCTGREHALSLFKEITSWRDPQEE